MSDFTPVPSSNGYFVTAKNPPPADTWILTLVDAPHFPTPPIPTVEKYSSYLQCWVESSRLAMPNSPEFPDEFCSEIDEEITRATQITPTYWRPLHEQSLVCECCGATHDADIYAAALAGWRKTYDGWVCCAITFIPEVARTGMGVLDLRQLSEAETPIDFPRYTMVTRGDGVANFTYAKQVDGGEWCRVDEIVRSRFFAALVASTPKACGGSAEAIKLLRSFQSHFGPFRPEDDGDDAETWDQIDTVIAALSAKTPDAKPAPATTER